MPLTANLGGKKYVLGRGQVLFDRFPNGVSVGPLTQGDGERYIGNTPEFSTSSESESLDHYDSDAGVNVKDASVQLSLDRTGSMTCDNIDEENIALNFLGTASVVAQASATGLINVIPGVLKGRFYQLGVSESNPSGVRNVKNVVVKTGGAPTWGTTVTQVGNYQVDEARGRIYIEDDALVLDDDDIQVTFDLDASTRSRVVSGSDAIYGSLRFVANNAYGENKDYFFPYVKLSPDGDYNLKGDEWQTIGFTFEILKKASNIEALYIDGQGEVSP